LGVLAPGLKFDEGFDEVLKVLLLENLLMLDERRDEMLARLFAVADDIDARPPLIVHGQTQGVVLAGGQFFALQLPRRPERLRCRKPGGLGQAAGSRCGQQRFHKK